MKQLNLFPIYDTKWLIEQCTKSMTVKESEVLKETGRIGTFTAGYTDEEELIRIFRLFYYRRHEPDFGSYTQHPRNRARSTIWSIRYLRHHREKESE